MRRALLLPLMLAGCQETVELDVRRANTVSAVERPEAQEGHVRRVTGLPCFNGICGSIIVYDDEEVHVRCYVVTGEERGISCVKLDAKGTHL